jgi:hypothetical protein
LPLDGFNAVAGKVIADTVDVTAPYDAVQRITLASGEHAEQEARLAFGSPLVAGHQVQCKPYRENGTALNDYGGPGDPVIQTLTLQGLAAPSNVRLGGTSIGGTFQ